MLMHLYLMNIDEGSLLVLAGVFLFLMVLGLVEGWVIYRYKVTSFWRAVPQGAFVNLVSLLFGFVLFYFMEREQYSGFSALDNGSYSLPLWGVLWALSVFIEGLLLKALNRLISWGLIFKTSVVMNGITFMILLVYVYFI
jgi:hypothetical protein